MALMTWQESRDKCDGIIKDFIAEFFERNGGRCMDNEEDREVVAEYLAENIPAIATQLTTVPGTPTIRQAPKRLHSSAGTLQRSADQERAGSSSLA